MRREGRSQTVSQLDRNKLFQTRLVRMQMTTGIPPTAGLFSDQLHWLETEAPPAGVFSYQSHWLP
ncbi:hypothetical protein NP493_15g03068 [Ridgeia piscesae]|uniref:Uncharacterized protein n=1 Tax=Ridgeia piscesae TaxID=27915 RepID=A0AAD9MTK2_RIDPI|nr:hypothetical protein NP493_4460g00004 [Ridgeia piscesae]KAK2143633.1 hypothetical protein NP493_4460g00000 [Ridgeia piscesae]KAK2193335.1 hypothetical protein NP493_15g03068 [Ridgeia piscesae]